jgi:hypothetical protein
MSEHIVISQSILTELLECNSNDKTVPVIASELFDDSSRHALAEQKIKEFESVFNASFLQIKKLIGEPEKSTTVDGFPIDKWFPETLEAKIWIKKSKLLCLALLQYDAEGPVAVILRSIKASDIKDLADW